MSSRPGESLKCNSASPIAACQPEPTIAAYAWLPCPPARQPRLGAPAVGVYGDGLIVRIGAPDMDAATAQPGVRPFDMTGRPMRGIAVIDSTALDDQALDRWIGQARGYVAGVPPK